LADYTALNTLPRIDLDVTAQNKTGGQEGFTTVTVHNPTSTLALAVHLAVNKSSSGRVSREREEDNEILPVLWQDNYFALLPGETRQVTATYPIGDKNKSEPNVEIDGWNVNRKTADVRQ
jgi:exo-1,4-beta-D-glucosaminidase